MPVSDEYDARAAECVRLARETDYPDSKALLLEMAQAWIRLAVQAREKERQEAD